MTARSRLLLAALGVVLVLVALGIGDLLTQKLDPKQYAEQLLRERRAKDNNFLGDPESPIPDSLKIGFKGLAYFPPDLAFRFEGTFRETDNLRFSPLEIGLSLEVAGILRFEHAGQTHELVAFYNTTPGEAPNRKPGAELLIPFADATTGSSTYGGGRYLTLTPDGTRAVLDFNTAYNPYCAYDPGFVCAKPPPQNRLPFAVLAGEKNWQ